MRPIRRRRRSAHPGGLTCKELVELVTDYLEGTLPASQRRRFDEHIRACVGCTTYVDQIRATIAIAGRLDEDALEPAARDALLVAFRNWSDARR
jgi:anti-sigma factor RsiW